MSKYNNKKVEVLGYKFDSKIESEYFLYLLKRQELGEIACFEMQVPFVLLEPYALRGRKIRGINYIADFVVYYHDKAREGIDIKGFETSDFKLKKKLFEYKYEIPLKLITYSKIDGGWIDLNELAKARKERKKLKDINKSNKL